MHKVTVASSIALTFTVLSTLGFSKICDRRVFCANNSFLVVSSIESLHGVPGLFLIMILDIDVPNHVVSNVICDYYFFDFSELG